MLSFRVRVPHLIVCAVLSYAAAAGAQESPPGAAAPAPTTVQDGTPPPQAPEPARPTVSGGDTASVGSLLVGPPRAPFTLDAAAYRPECRWTGQRIVSLLWRDDINTALQHLQIYNTFGCPEEQLRVVFACLIRQGDFDPQGTPALAVRILSCWTNPSASSATAIP